MANRVEFLAASRNVTSVKFMKFIKIHARNPVAVVCFFEGEDQKYYGVRIDLAKPNFQYECVDCGGKSQVIQLFELISNHDQYKTARAAYFVDRDFDMPLSADKRHSIYETPCYSVENLYCNTDVVRRILNAELKIDEDGDEDLLYRKCFGMFVKLQKEFHTAIRPVNAYIKAHRHLEAAGGVSALNLNNLSLDKLVLIKLDSVVSIYDAKSLPSLFSTTASVSNDDITTADITFSDDDLVNVLRGKYEIEFVRQFFVKLRDESRQGNSEFHSLNGRIRLQLSKTNLISELSQYASTPPCLREYLSALAN